MKLHATGRDLLIKESERLISGSIKIYECEFTFDESWDGYTVTAVFSTNGSRLINMAVVDGKCEIPSEVLRPNARIRIGVFGIDGDRRRPTTYSEWITVEQGVDLGGGSAQPPTPSVYEQWLRGLDEKQDEWNANEEARAEAESARVEAENARVEAEEAREAQETGYVAQAESWAKEAEDQAKDAKAWADKAQEVVGGDFATKAQAQAMADAAEVDANAYTDQQIAAIPTPDVSGQIGKHNTSDTAHADIREAFGGFHTKAEVLADDTKTLFGLGSEAVPDDVLNVLSKAVLVQSVPKFTKHTIANPTYGKAVGSTVSLNVNGVATDFLVVHRGKPSNLYDDSCNGCWLVAKNIYTVDKWTSGSYGNSYADSTIHTYLNDTFLSLLDADTQWMAKQVKIPYAKGSAATTAQTGANGLSTKVFLLGSNEVGCSSSVYSNLVDDGSKLDYFGTGGGAEPTRVANYGSSAYPWATRTAMKSTSDQVFLVGTTGDVYSARASTSTGIRPALILPLEKDVVYYADSNGSRYSEQAYTTVLTNVLNEEISVGAKVVVGSYKGTGTYGESNPNSLTFDFEPKLVIITRGATDDADGVYSAYSSTDNAMLLMKYAVIRWSDSSNVLGYDVRVKFDGKTVSWYTKQSNAECQANASSTSTHCYHYIALG